jgi:uncharacterized protein
MIPVRRDIRFALPPERIADWHEAGPVVTEYMNAMSLMFPAGERFFMDSVRHYRDQITDPVLKQQVAGFIGQEAMHTREHVEYNDLMEAAGLPAHRLDQWLWKFLAFGRKIGGPKLALSFTLALEHYTAMFAGTVMEDADAMINGVEGYKRVWMWHAYEETEHKAVSYDVWTTVMKPNLFNYLVRAGGMVLVTAVFWPVLVYFMANLIPAHRRNVGKIGVFDWLRLGSRLFGPRRGLAPKIWREYLDYFRPGFHPWDHDNSDKLNQLEELLEGIGQANLVYAPDSLPRRVPLHPEAQAMA